VPIEEEEEEEEEEKKKKKRRRRRMRTNKMHFAFLIISNNLSSTCFE
jgi:hypothetical protein